MNSSHSDVVNVAVKKPSRQKIMLRKLRVSSLKYRPDFSKLFNKMRQCIKNKNNLITKLKRQLKELRKKRDSKENSTQTESNTAEHIPNETATRNNESTEIHSKNNTKPEDNLGWDLKENEKALSIADQVKEVAQNALQQTGMVYVESAGMYYDYKTGYYYNSELGLYYHSDTGCYYYYCNEKNSFVFHSYPDRSAEVVNPGLIAHEKKKARKHKKGKEEDGSSKAKKPKRRKTQKKTQVNDKSAPVKENVKENGEIKKNYTKEGKDKDIDIFESSNKDGESAADVIEKSVKIANAELEDGECSDTESESAKTEDEDSPAESNSTISDDDSVARHYPPCMRVIVKQTTLPKLKVGSLFLVTKDGGSIGREGDHHCILLRDQNVSRNHLNITYNNVRKTYVAMDLGSKNGTNLNGIRMSESQTVSKSMEIVHGSVLDIGETKLLCHIHPGNDTCGHCEPGLLMETTDKEKKAAYTRTCSVQKQHQMELARLKNIYAPKPLAIEETAYKDRAQTRRETVGSSHYSEKTQTSDLDTFITPENKGFKLLEKMGWSKGEGLGKDNQGSTEPIPLISNEGKAGLGTAGEAAPTTEPTPVKTKLATATLRLVSKTNMLQLPAKAFQANEDDEED